MSARMHGAPPADPTDHAFRPCDPKCMIDKHFCRHCGLHRSQCIGRWKQGWDAGPPPEPPEEYQR